MAYQPHGQGELIHNGVTTFARLYDAVQALLQDLRCNIWRMFLIGEGCRRVNMCILGEMRATTQAILLVFHGERLNGLARTSSTISPTANHKTPMPQEDSDPQSSLPRSNDSVPDSIFDDNGPYDNDDDYAVSAANAEAGDHLEPIQFSIPPPYCTAHHTPAPESTDPAKEARYFTLSGLRVMW